MQLERFRESDLTAKLNVHYLNGVRVRTQAPVTPRALYLLELKRSLFRPLAKFVRTT